MAIAAGCVVAAVLVLGGSTAAPRTVSVAHAVFDLAADGERVAFANEYQGHSSCSGAATWNISSGRRVNLTVPTAALCEGDIGGVSVESIAIAGRRVVWSVSGGSNTYRASGVFVGRVGGSRPRRVAHAEIDVGGSRQDYVGHVAGGGSRILYLSWTFRSDGTRRSELLWEVPSAGPPRRLAEVPGVVALTVDRDRVGVLRDEGTLVLLDRSGRVVRRLSVAAARPLRSSRGPDIALDGDIAVVRGRRALVAVHIVSGRLLRSWRLRSSEIEGEPLTRGLDVSRGIVSSSGREVLVLRRIRDGREVVVRPDASCSILTAALSSHGLVQSVSCEQFERNRLVFEPLAAVQRRFAR